ncbi:hypothetical protein [Paludibacterium sp. B53371]|uniref:hypothetical protein n=1 Tax=Paludibacterium sp. B53371 TaxID=2806263 RepID=UPI001C05951D|nr:hypothetical protein [Paludibacterium sp. B53371]
MRSVNSILIWLALTKVALATELGFDKIGDLDMTSGRPVVIAQVAGETVGVVLDTSASEAVLLEGFAKKKGLLMPGRTPEDGGLFLSAGKDIPVVLGKHEFRLQEVMVLSDQGRYDIKNAGLVLNPNAINCQHCLIVLDYIGRVFALANSTDIKAVEQALSEPYGKLVRASAEMHVLENNAALYMSSVSLGAGVTSVLLDTGSNYTTFLKVAIPNQVRMAGKSLIRMKDARMTVHETEPVSIRVNQTEIAKTAVRVEPASSFAHYYVTYGNFAYFPHQGSIGMDVLRNCILAIEPKKTVHLLCRKVADRRTSVS